MKARVTLTLDSDFLGEIDEARGDVSRSRFVEKLLFGAWEASSRKQKKPKEKTEEEVQGYA